MHNNVVGTYLLFMILFSTFTTISTFHRDNLIANSQSDNSEVTSPNFENYQTPETIMIQYPENWKKIELPSLDGVLFHSTSDFVGVIVQNRPANNITESALLNEISIMLQNLPDMLINNFTSTNANNIFQQEIIFTFANNSSKEQVYQFKKMENNRLYQFTFFANKDLFDIYIPIASKMFSSFITPSNQSSIFLDDNMTLKRPISIDTDRSIENASNKESVNSENGEKDQNNRTKSFEIIEHEDLSKGINFSYPAFFNLTENDNGIHLLTDNGTTGFLIDLQPPIGQPLSNFTNAQVSYLENTLQNFSIVNSIQETVFQRPAELVYFNYANNSKTFDGLQIITADTDRGYIFTYFSPRESFNLFLPYIIDTIDSTVLLNG